MAADPTGIELARSCLDAGLRAMAPWQSEHRIVEDEGLLFVVGQRRFPTGYSNTAFPRGPVPDPDALLARVAEFYAPLGRPYILWTVAGLHDELEARALAAGLGKINEMPAMLLREPLATADPPAGIELDWVSDERGVADYRDVSGQAYEETGLPQPVIRSYFVRTEVILGDGNHLVLARHQGRAVAAALSVARRHGSRRVADVCWVGARPEARRLGAGQACTRAVTNAAFDWGADVVALEASPMGEPIYRRMGYQEVGRYRWFVGGNSGSGEL